MIHEIAVLTADPARAADFEAAVARARPLFLAAPGCHGLRLDRVIEQPGTWHLVVAWESVAHHMEGFRSSPAFAEWRALAGPFFTAPPVVFHTETVLG